MATESLSPNLISGRKAGALTFGAIFTLRVIGPVAELHRNFPAGL